MRRIDKAMHKKCNTRLWVEQFKTHKELDGIIGKLGIDEEGVDTICRRLKRKGNEWLPRPEWRGTFLKQVLECSGMPFPEGFWDRERTVRRKQKSKFRKAVPGERKYQHAKKQWTSLEKHPAPLLDYEGSFFHINKAPFHERNPCPKFNDDPMHIQDVIKRIQLDLVLF